MLKEIKETVVISFVVLSCAAYVLAIWCLPVIGLLWLLGALK